VIFNKISKELQQRYPHGVSYILCFNIRGKQKSTILKNIANIESGGKRILKKQ